MTVGLPTSSGRPNGSTFTIAHRETEADNELIAHEGSSPEAILPQVLGEYGDEAHRLSLEDDVHRRQLEIERKKAEGRVAKAMDNADLHALMRSFDKKIQTVRMCPPPYDHHIPSGLDLQPSPEEAYSVHKMRSALERFYQSIVMGMLRTVYEVQRIRHWQDGGFRSLVALIVYTYAWWCNLIFATLFGFFGLLVLSPLSRRYLFAPPLFLDIPENIDSETTTRVAKQQIHDRWGPAASEAQASQWAARVQDALVAISGGNAKKVERKTQEDLKKALDVELNHTMKIREAAGQKEDKEEKLSRREKVELYYAQPAMHIVSGLADKWERLANALSPQADWTLEERRKTVFWYLIAPALAISILVSERLISRIAGILFGVLMFGQPVIDHILQELDVSLPGWREAIILKFNMLETVPTDAQVVLRILRRHEHELRPIPLGPTGAELEDSEQTEGESELESDVDSADEGAEREGSKTKLVRKAGELATKVTDTTRKALRRTRDKTQLAKEEGFAFLAGQKKVDYRHKAEHAMSAIGIDTSGKKANAALEKLSPGTDRDDPTNPSTFYVWHKKHGPGHIVIHPPVPSTGRSARIEFTTIRHVPPYHNAEFSGDHPPPDGHLVIDINTLVGLKKIGMNLIKRTAYDVALDVEGTGETGLEVKLVRRVHEEAVKGPGPTVAQGLEETIEFNGIVRRDELFNRLLTIGDQRWELY